MATVATDRAFLRHTLATLAYRGAKATRGAPPDFAAFKASPTTRTPIEILEHVGDLMEWTLSLAKENHKYEQAAQLPWDEQVNRFHSNMAKLDAFFATDAPFVMNGEALFQGPIADALTHVGQINLLRRMFGAPVKGENYTKAAIEAGRVGEDQKPPDPKYEFD
jgi:hypothetical protein